MALADLKPLSSRMAAFFMRDPVNNLILPLIGAGILFSAWWYDILPWSAIKYLLMRD
jgi:hypothetical protein